jgi:D-amino-acid dehydrogenase
MRDHGVKTDVVVLGAGIVGISVALQLQKRGRSVALVDRRGPGEEASYGNFGLIERATLYPPSFPRGMREILRYASNRAPEARYHYSALPKILPWLISFWHHSAPANHANAMRFALPLIEHSVTEHEALAEAADALCLFGRQGFLRLARTPRYLQSEIDNARKLDEYGLRYQVLSNDELHALEPDLARSFVGAVRYLDPVSVTDPGGLTKSYAALFETRGGTIARGDAVGLKQEGCAWLIASDIGLIRARDAVISLGGWSNSVLRPLGYRIPLVVKRGYHRHFQLRGNTKLNHPIADAELGYAVAPMNGKVRVTSGIEFGLPDVAPTPVQIGLATDFVRSILPLGEPLDAAPWMGLRPCMPDMLPVIGPAGKHQRLWFAFGHGHHGFTLGPVTGRLLAEMMTCERPFTDPTPYHPARFR